MKKELADKYLNAWKKYNGAVDDVVKCELIAGLIDEHKMLENIVKARADYLTYMYVKIIKYFDDGETVGLVKRVGFNIKVIQWGEQ